MAVKVKDERIEVVAVISTAPANILPKLVNGTDVLEKVADFRYRAMTILNIRLTGEKLLPDTVMWFPEKNSSSSELLNLPFQCPGWPQKEKRFLR